MSTANGNWRAKCDAPGHILVRFYGVCHVEHGIDVANAIQLRYELTTAIEEAKRLDDPFERWWEGVANMQRNDPDYPFRRVGRSMMTKAEARIIWDAAKRETTT